MKAKFKKKHTHNYCPFLFIDILVFAYIKPAIRKKNKPISENIKKNNMLILNFDLSRFSTI